MGWKRKAALAVILGLGVMSAGLYAWLRTSLPQIDGNVRLSGLRGPATIGRDAWGIPRIEAGSQHDAYFALGYTHAQDRLWQMESQRRLGQGRLSEIMGARTLGIDRFIRTLGLYRLAEASVAAIEPEVRQALEAYANGVNAFLTSHEGALPVEFVALSHQPEPWRPADSLVWGRLMALQLAGNWTEELVRVKLAGTLPKERIEMLWPRLDGPTTVMSAETADGLLAVLPAVAQPKLASNEWVVTGPMSATGKPLLANDPHLGFQVPILWYLASVKAPGLEVTGATVPGVPFHLLGHNGRIAWAITTTHSDTMDLFVERPAGDGLYDTPDGPQPYEVRQEVIQVRGAEPVRLTVRSSRHGPIISDLGPERSAGDGTTALAAAALLPEDLTGQSIYRLNRAQDWPGFLSALRDFHAPQQNFAYADVEGDIGFVSPGRVPIRKAGDGNWPRPGWNGAFDWISWIPFDDLPRLYNPPSHSIVNANNQPVPEDYPYLLATHWPEPYRAQRILERLRPAMTLDDMAKLQQDSYSPDTAQLLPLLLAAPASSEQARKAAALLKSWDGVMDRKRPEPLIYTAWLYHLQQAILAPHLGEMAKTFVVPRPVMLKDALSGAYPWCGAPAAGALPCQTEIAASLEQALEYMGKLYGPNPAEWRWGQAHQAVFDHILFGRVSGLETLTGLQIPADGGNFTINRGASEGSAEQFHQDRHGPGFRGLYDLSNLTASRFVIATGQSGNLLSSHYSDLLEAWRDGKYVSMAAKDPLPHVLSLEPAP